MTIEMKKMKIMRKKLSEMTKNSTKTMKMTMTMNMKLLTYTTKKMPESRMVNVMLRRLQVMFVYMQFK